MKKIATLLSIIATALFFGTSFALVAANIAPESTFTAFEVGCGLGASLATINSIVPFYQYSNFYAVPLVIKFKKEVEEKLSPDNTFYINSVDDGAYLDGKTVRKGVAGDDPTVVTNPTSFPLTVFENVDDNLDYDISRHATLPQRIDNEQELILSFAKRQTVVNAHARVLDVKIAEEMVYNWQPTVAGNLLDTTGAMVTGSLTHKGATGTRRAITLADIIKACELLDRQDANGDRYGLINSIQYSQLLQIPDFVDYNKTGRSGLLEKGIIGEICGVKLYKRSSAGAFDTSKAKKKISAVTAATDKGGLLIWDSSLVTRAKGPVKVYWNPDKGEYLGGILNMEIRAGGSIRKDGIGVVAIVEAAV